jgi:hypothetical protein
LFKKPCPWSYKQRPSAILSTMTKKALIVTHHAPDLDAIGASWILKRFDSQTHATAQVAFVNPGSRISLEEADRLGYQLHEVTHVDTGLGQFDHHQPERGQLRISASSLVYEHVCTLHPELKTSLALKAIAEHITDVDHFGEVHWPSDCPLHGFMLHEVIRGCELVDPNNDESQLFFGMKCLDNVHAVLTQHFRAETILTRKGESIELQAGKALAISTRNDDTVKLAQKKGYQLVIRKDPQQGHIRIKARPDSTIDLTALYERIKTVDTVGTWYFHPSGKMLINGSRKHRSQKPSPLSLEAVVSLVKELYA